MQDQGQEPRTRAEAAKYKGRLVRKEFGVLGWFDGAVTSVREGDNGLWWFHIR